MLLNDYIKPREGNALELKRQRLKNVAQTTLNRKVVHDLQYSTTTTTTATLITKTITMTNKSNQQQQQQYKQTAIKATAFDECNK